MAFRDQVKQALRHIGHAMASSIHDRLNGVDAEIQSLRSQASTVHEAQKDFVSQLRNIETKVNALAADSGETHTTLLQSEIYVVEHLRRLQAEVEDGQAQYLRQLARQGAAFTQSQKDMLAEMRQQLDHLRQELPSQICIETSDYGALNPETGLMQYLYSYLPSRKAIDVGAHVGDVSARLLKTGYEVFAFEPYAPSYEKLTRRLAGESRFHPHNLAIGSMEGEFPLHLAADRSSQNRYDDATVFNSLAVHGMPDDLPFVDTVPVPVKNLASLHRAGSLPTDISLVKIDTEGFDLEVIRGMQEFRYPVVLAEFWDTAIPFAKSGLLYTAECLVEEMRDRGYGWHIVIYRVWGQNHTAFYCNHDRSVAHSWGNIVFFQNFDLFWQAQRWCAATLPHTFFKSAPAQ
jgi:FkbM family methyltransferase